MLEICGRIDRFQEKVQNLLQKIKGNKRDIVAMKGNDAVAAYDFDGATRFSSNLEKQAEGLNELVGSLKELISAIAQSKDVRQKARSWIDAALDSGDRKGFDEAMAVVAAEKKNLETLGKQLAALQAKIASIPRHPLRKPIDLLMQQVEKLDEVKKLRKAATISLHTSVNMAEALSEGLLDIFDLAAKRI